MTRRSETEAMLARYGSETTLGGDRFSAFISPMRAGNTGGEPRFSYIGPAAHKLSAGQTVTSDGCGYEVKQCETVHLAGEELFVRAVLARLPDSRDTDVRLERDGKLLAHAGRCTAEAACGAEEFVPWGESGPAEIAGGAVRWKITLEDLKAEAGADLFAPGAFTVTAEHTAGKTVYTGCRWTLIRSVSGTDCGYSCRMEALAAGREETEAKTGG